MDENLNNSEKGGRYINKNRTFSIKIEKGRKQERLKTRRENEIRDVTEKLTKKRINQLVNFSSKVIKENVFLLQRKKKMIKKQTSFMTLTN